MIRHMCVVSYAAALLLAFPQSGTAQTSLETYKIGVTYPLTGPFVSSAQAMLSAAELAVSDINRTGGIKGHPLQLVVEDSKGTPEGGILAMRKVVQVDGVQAILTIYTNVVMAQLPLADQLKVPLLSTIEAPGLMSKWKYGFQHADSIATHTSMLRDYWRATHVRRVFGFYPNNAFGPLVNQSAQTAADGAGAQYLSVSFNPGETDYRGSIARAKDFQPDTIYIGAQGGVDESEAIRNALASLTGVRSVFGGEITMDAERYSVPANLGLWRVRDGKLIRIWPVRGPVR